MRLKKICAITLLTVCGLTSTAGNGNLVINAAEAVKTETSANNLNIEYRPLLVGSFGEDKKLIILIIT